MYHSTDWGNSWFSVVGGQGIKVAPTSAAIHWCNGMWCIHHGGNFPNFYGYTGYETGDNQLSWYLTQSGTLNPAPNGAGGMLASNGKLLGMYRPTASGNYWWPVSAFSYTPATQFFVPPLRGPGMAGAMNVYVKT
jgi:hypothetical protein